MGLTATQIWTMGNPLPPTIERFSHKEEEEEEWRCIYLWEKIIAPQLLYDLFCGCAKRKRLKKSAFYYGPEKKISRPIIYHIKKEMVYYQTSITLFTPKRVRKDLQKQAFGNRLVYSLSLELSRQAGVEL